MGRHRAGKPPGYESPPRWRTTKAPPRAARRACALIGKRVCPSRPRELFGEGLLDDAVVQAKVTLRVASLGEGDQQPHQRPCGEGHYPQSSRLRASWARAGRKSATRVFRSGAHRGGSSRSHTARSVRLWLGWPPRLCRGGPAMRATWAARGRVVRYSRDVMEEPPPVTVGWGKPHRIRL